MAKYKTPGVYIEEKSAMAHSVVPVPTSIPAFLGYTEQAILNGKDQTHRPVRITSLSEFESVFGKGHRTSFSLHEDGDEWRPEYNGPRFMLYDSIRLFFANGGGICYVVSVGSYQAAVTLEGFLGKEGSARSREPQGIHVLRKETEPSILVIPDAVLLSKEECSQLQREMLRHCGEIMKSRFAILDIHDGFEERSGDTSDVITLFREGIGEEHLSYGAAYYPWVETTVVSPNQVDFRNLNAEGRDLLAGHLKARVKADVNEERITDKQGEQLITEVAKLTREEWSDKEAQTVHVTLEAYMESYRAILAAMVNQLKVLPPSGAMAGIYAQVDNAEGVWKAPANVSLASVVRPAVPISNQQQEDLNAPPSGKSVNAIREFPGKGVLVWGARTLAGNDNEWRYVPVRRLAIFVEESIKQALLPFVFEPNEAATWTAIESMTTDFLMNIWRAGGLMGAKPEEGFSVKIGLGQTMTAQDLTEGRLVMHVLLAVVRPAEFIILRFEQKMPTS
jgi:phage tail sheath protein FI